MGRRKSEDVMESAEEITQECKETELPEVKDWCSTGCTTLDIAMSDRFPGGIPMGRIIQVYGGTSTCKSLFAYTIMGYAQRAGFGAYYADIERALNPDFAKRCGFNLDDKPSYEIGYPSTLEEFFDEWMDHIVKDGKAGNKIIIVDSLTALPSKMEIDKQMDEQGYGSVRARQMSLGFRKYRYKMAENSITLICIDQTRVDLKSPWGAEVTTGGKALDFYSDIRIHLKLSAKIKDSKDIIKGNWVDFCVDKTRFGPPFRDGTFKLLFDYGLDDIATNLSFLAYIQSKSMTEAMKTLAKVKFKGEEMTAKGWVTRIEAENLEAELKQAVWDAWQELYKPDDRKARVW
jgi:protein RecA